MDDREQYYLPLKEAIDTYIKDDKTKESIHDAFLFAMDAHSEQKRASGEPYIIHPVSVALTLCGYKADPTTLEAALLHDVIEDTKYGYNNIKEKFGIEVANLVEGLTKIQKMEYSDVKNSDFMGESEYASNFQKMLLSMSRDIRVIWIKLSDRLNNMNTLKYLPYEKQVRISNETLSIYAPIAHKLGMYKIKAELEDLSFKYLYPEDYKEISKKIATTKKEREKDIEKMMETLKDLLMVENVNCEISGRAKNIYSTYNKMKKKDLAFENIYDLLALRIIVDTVMDCYKVIGIVHSNFSPLPSRFKDYIAMPKPNMYQSLHTAVLSDGKIYEIQIRTHEMNEIAENGIAAHWAYKEGVKLNSKYYESTASKLRWYNELLKYTDGETKEDKENLTQMFTEDVLEANVYVFTPKNAVIALPEGSTPLDFAYRIHSRVGDHYTGAIVNGKIVPIDYQFKTGDICEIKTSPNAYGPNENWIKIAKTSSAKNKIKQFLNKKNRDLLIDQGKQMIEQELKNRKLDIVLTDELVSQKSNPDKQIRNLEELYYAAGKGVFGVQALVNDFEEHDDISTNQQVIDFVTKKYGNQTFHEDVDIIVDGLTCPSVKLAHCCMPVPGDDIVGYVTKGVGIAVHRKNCKNALGLDQNRFVSVRWGHAVDKRFNVQLKIMVSNRDNILADIINIATSNNAKVTGVSAKANENNEAFINITVQVVNKTELDLMIYNLEKIKGIYSIDRVFK